MNSNHPRAGHAIVIGASIAGLAAARVLSDRFETVTVLERGPHPDGPDPRKAVPQARHIHVVLEAAVLTLRAWFPGIIDEMVADGARLVDMGSAAAWFHCGGWKPRFRSDIESILCTRGLVEHHLRRRVAALPNVQIRYETAAAELTTGGAGATSGAPSRARDVHPSRSRVTGVRLTGPAGDETLAADLVVDAAGRGTRAPRWLEALGYGAPPEERVEIDLAYTSALFEPPPAFSADWKILILYSRAPDAWRAGFVNCVEGGRWIVSLSGYFGDHAPLDLPGFLEFARSLPRPELHEAVRNATPLGPLTTHKVPNSRWFHYEKMDRLPDGYVVLGDSVCALNPIYGQGMTVSFLGAQALGRCLDASGPGHSGLPLAFQKKLVEVIAMPWLLSTTMDLAYPRATGKRAPGLSALQWGFANLIDLSSVDESVCRPFYEVLHMRKGIEALVRPGVVLPLVAQGVKSLFLPLAARVNGGDIPPAPAR